MHPTCRNLMELMVNKTCLGKKRWQSMLHLPNLPLPQNVLPNVDIIVVKENGAKVTDWRRILQLLRLVHLASYWVFGHDLCLPCSWHGLVTA